MRLMLIAVAALGVSTISAGEPGKQPFAAECTSIANLERTAQNRTFEAITDRAGRQAALDAAEKDGTRVKPEFGSVW